ncbi:MAG: YbgC/FadM family acyl-CoA thioesterase [candidate division Zixibacteria bacterium]|nr:YbgC/FadM family acyl-CoA thioesterase [candidate division Zixibacteria bacterium]
MVHDVRVDNRGGRACVVTPLRVRYAETDAMGVVYYGDYLAYFEDGRVAYLRAKGLPYSAMEAAGVYMPVAEAYCKYHAPARFEDELAVETSIGGAGRARVRFDYVVKRGEEVLAEGYTVHAARGRDGRPVRIPASWAEKLSFPKD